MKPAFEHNVHDMTLTREHVVRWTQRHSLSPIHVDCATTVMLKILDGKCKMKPEEKRVMALLYDQINERPGELLSDDMHQLIAQARDNLDENLQALVYEKRLLAETMISRPVMKGFKALLREQGLFKPDTDVSS